jgi:signal transduction histidine kinase
VRDLVERHGGNAWAEEGARGGARFVVSLPSTGETAAEPPGAHGR